MAVATIIYSKEGNILTFISAENMPPANAEYTVNSGVLSTPGSSYTKAYGTGYETGTGNPKTSYPTSQPYLNGDVLINDADGLKQGDWWFYSTYSSVSRRSFETTNSSVLNAVLAHCGNEWRLATSVNRISASNFANPSEVQTVHQASGSWNNGEFVFSINYTLNLTYGKPSINGFVIPSIVPANSNIMVAVEGIDGENNPIIAYQWEVSVNNGELELLPSTDLIVNYTMPASGTVSFYATPLAEFGSGERTFAGTVMVGEPPTYSRGFPAADGLTHNFSKPRFSITGASAEITAGQVSVDSGEWKTVNVEKWGNDYVFQCPVECGTKGKNYTLTFRVGETAQEITYKWICGVDNSYTYAAGTKITLENTNRAYDTVYRTMVWRGINKKGTQTVSAAKGDIVKAEHLNTLIELLRQIGYNKPVYYPDELIMGSGWQNVITYCGNHS